ncbi:MAG: DUF975 family protein [Clostridia bacterium]|nr:DUF975 family protein [Clostridia bacterium]
MTASEHRELARGALSGRWGLAIGAGLVATALMGGTSFSFSFPANFENESFYEAFNHLSNEEIMAFVAIVISVFAAIFAIAFIAGSLYGIFSSIIQAGYASFNLKLIDYEEPAFRDLFSQFRNAKSVIVAYLLRFAFELIGYMLFIIPGIIISYNYAMVPYILADNPSVSGKEALRISKEMMQGNRLRLFCLQLSFIGWELLTVLSFGVGLIWLIPYQNATIASFYRELAPIGTEEFV